MSIFAKIERFLLNFCPSPSPLLLALSGGADSLCLFYALLSFRERYGIPFHIAHVDHQWRAESQQEAELLHTLAAQHQVPFHLKVLNPGQLKGNLEAACREERYAFFAEMCQQFVFQGVLTGHHQDDQAETIFKRIFEGAHWSRWVALQPENWIKGIRILRPLLDIPKKEIQQALAAKNIPFFDDPSNRNPQFLRARLRESLFPRLNQEFGKEIKQSLITMGQEAQELTDYFDARLSPLLKSLTHGPWGACLDLQTLIPLSLLELKYLLRLLSKQKGFFLSREIIEQAAHALQTGKANQLFAMGSHHLRIDRKRIFIVTTPCRLAENEALKFVPGVYLLNNWHLTISEESYFSYLQNSSWKEGWRGFLQSYLPHGTYWLGFKSDLKEFANADAIKKRWNQAKIPAFLYPFFPLIWNEEKICHEFLTGKSQLALNQGETCWKVEMSFPWMKEGGSV